MWGTPSVVLLLLHRGQSYHTPIYPSGEEKKERHTRSHQPANKLIQPHLKQLVSHPSTAFVLDRCQRILDD